LVAAVQQPWLRLGSARTQAALPQRLRRPAPPVGAGQRPRGRHADEREQLSFKGLAIDDLRRVRERALAEGATQMRGMNHGNALSTYFSDPEGNTVEVYLDTPWYIPQPHGDPLALSLSDEAIWAETEAACRADPGFMPLAQWQERFRQAAPAG
jgi:hypothetical protein